MHPLIQISNGGPVLKPFWISIKGEGETEPHLLAPVIVTDFKNFTQTYNAVFEWSNNPVLDKVTIVILIWAAREMPVPR